MSRSSITASRRGHTLWEMLATTLLLGMTATAAATLMRTGQRQQKIARDYSQIQTDMRSAVRRASRTIRHGYAVVNPSSSSRFAGNTASNGSQVIVKVPEPGNTSQVEVRFYLSGGTFYAQRADDTGSGLALMSGVNTLSFNYYQTSSATGTRTAVDSTPQSATEVGLTLNATSGLVTSSFTSYVALRNKNTGT